MVLTSIFTTMPGVLIWILPLLAVSLILRSSWLKGIIGERRVKHLIRRRLDPSIYREFSNVTVRVGDRTTQIDYIYVCPFGILVIETKNMRGWIFGGKNQAQWTQIIYRKKVKFQKDRKSTRLNSSH